MVCSVSVAAEPFNFVDWVKGVLGIQEEISDVSTDDVSSEDVIAIEDIKVVDDSDVIIVEPEAPPEDPDDTKTGSDEDNEIAPEELEVVDDEIIIIEEPEVILEPSEQPTGSSIVVIVKETEEVDLDVQAQDPDEDILSYSYTTPLNKEGQWKTTYGDAGEYTVTVTATDGKLSSSKDVLVLVNKKEEAPTIDSFSPIETELKAEEDTSIDFAAKASDKNKDILTYTWRLNGNEVSDQSSYSYMISFEDSGKHKLVLEVTDGVETVKNEWSIDVNNVNRLPVLENIASITVNEDEEVVIVPEAQDADGNELTFDISEPVGDSGVWQTTYDDAGVYDIIVTVSDGQDEVSQNVKVTVENVNRAPVILNIKKK